MSSADQTEDWWNEAQLSLAAQAGDLDRVKELLEAGSNVHGFDEIGRTALHYAAENEHFAIVSLLLEQGADVNAHHEPTASNTPLAEIAQSCSFEMASMLVAAGADPTIRGWMGMNALDHADKRKKEEGRRVYDLLARASKRHAVASTLRKR